MLWTVIIGKYKVVKYQWNVEQTNKMFTELCLYITENKLVKLLILTRLLGKEWNLTSIFQDRTVVKCKISFKRVKGTNIFNMTLAWYVKRNEGRVGRAI